MTSAIAAAVAEQTGATQEISRSCEIAARATEDVTNSIGAVKGIAGETDRAAHDVLDSSQNLATRAARLKQIVQAHLAAVRAA